MSSANPMNTGPREWDAQTYDRVSDPQYHWGLEVLDGNRRVVWRSAASRTGILQPSVAEAASFPEGNAYWRPVAVPGGEVERPGNLAAFQLREN